MIYRLLALWHGAVIAVLALLCVPLAVTAARSIFLLSYPFEVSYGEGAVANRLVTLAERGTYFLPIDQYPYIHGTYPPLFMLASLPLYQLTDRALLATRAVALASWLVILIMLWRLAYHWWRDPVVSAVPPLLWAASPIVLTWVPLGRVDWLALALTAAALWYLVRARPPWSRVSITAAGLLIAAALTKQNYQALPLALLVSLAADRSARPWLWRYAAAYAVPLVLLLLLGQWASGGQLWLHLFSYLVVPFEWSRAARGYEYFVRLTWPLLISLALTLPAVWRRLPQRTLLVAYLALALGMLVSYGKVGSDSNYFFEPWLALVIVSAAAGASLTATASARPLKLAVVSLVVLQLLVFHPWRVTPQLSTLQRWRDVEQPRKTTLAGLVRAAPGDVLSEDMSVLIAAGKPVLLEPFQFLHLARQQRWQPDQIIAGCRRGRFSLVIAGWRLHALPGLRACLREHYGTPERFGRLSVYRWQAQ